MGKKKSTFRKLVSFFMLAIAIYVLIQVYGIYKQKNMNDFIRAERNLYTSKFSRDFETTLGKEGSYKIESGKDNDAMFYKTIDVKPNTVYKVSCMVKTESVVPANANTGGGAQISLEGTIERSDYITGTQDWTELTLYFNTKNKTSVNIGFRLGGYDDMCSGTAWFDNLKLEKGIVDTSNEWNFVCFIFENVNVNLDENGSINNYNITMSQEEKNEIKSNMLRFKRSFEEFSEGKIRINYDIIEMKEPLTSLSYDDKNEYYVNPENVSSIINKYLNEKEYDHIFVAMKLGDLSKNIEIPVNDWIGLGGIEYRGIGFSNIRVPNSKKSYMYKYVSGVNEFPEEVFVHEFLHTLEKNAKDFGYERPELHSYEEYGYKNERVVGLKQWYIDYMNHKIKDSQGNTYGLDKEVYTLKPVHESDFVYKTNIEIENEPKNIIEEIRGVFLNVFKLFEKVKLEYNIIKE